MKEKRAEAERTQDMLYDVFPPHIADRLRSGEKVRDRETETETETETEANTETETETETKNGYTAERR